MAPEGKGTLTIYAPAEIGHGEGYRYPHDDPAGWVAQQYRPDDVGSIYYEPSDHGFEATLGGDDGEESSSADGRGSGDPGASP